MHGDWSGVGSRKTKQKACVCSTVHSRQVATLTRVEIYNEDEERQRECVYYLALGYYRLGQYAESRQFNDLLLQLEPHNLQAQSLRRLINDRVQRGASCRRRILTA
jgi:fission 1 protein